MNCFKLTFLYSILFLLPAIGGAEIIGVDFISSFLYSIDENTGTGRKIGTVSGPSFPNSLAQNSSGVLFSVGDLPSGPFTLSRTPTLFTINPVTGAGHVVGDIFYDYPTRTNEGSGVSGLAFSPDGILFAVNNPSPPSLFPRDLITIDTSPRIRGDVVGRLVGGTGLLLTDIAFSPSGTLYGWDVNIGLVTLDPLTGVATDVNPLVGATEDIQGLTFSRGGTLFGATNALFTIDPATGTTTLVGRGGFGDVRGIQDTTVPEPNTLVLLGVSLAVIFGWRRATPKAKV